jgi:hypothetical protein
VLGSLPRLLQVVLLFKNPPRFELRIALIMAIALLLAQFGAMTHAYSHDAQLNGAAQQTGAYPPHPSIHDFCGDCLNFAPLLSVAGAPDVLTFAAPQSLALVDRAVDHSQIAYRFLVAFRSRAPPVTQ